MSDDTSNAALQAMIDRAGRITADEAETLDATWKADEGILLPEPSASLAIQGGADGRMVTNADLIAAWQHALDAAGAAGRVEEIEAAQEPGARSGTPTRDCATAPVPRKQSGPRCSRPGCATSSPTMSTTH